MNGKTQGQKMTTIPKIIQKLNAIRIFKNPNYRAWHTDSKTVEQNTKSI